MQVRSLAVALAVAALAPATLAPGLARAQDRKKDEPTWAGEQDLGVKAYKAGRYPEAEAHLAAAVRLAEKIGANEPKLAQSLYWLGEVSYAEGKVPDAEAAMRRAAAIRTMAFGPESRELADAQRRLADFLMQQRKLDEAQPLAEHALAVDEKADPKSSDTGQAVNTLACICYGRGDRAKAKELFLRALAVFEATLGKESTPLIAVTANLGEIASGEGKNDEARTHFERSLAICEKVRGAAHPATADALISLAVFLAGWSKDDEAEPLLRRAQTIQEKAIGPLSPETSRSLAPLAELLGRKEKWPEAEALFRRAVGNRENALGLESSNTLGTIDRFGVLLLTEGKNAEAEAQFARALPAWEKVLGAESAGLVSYLAHLGDARLRQAKLDEATSVLERAVAIGTKTDRESAYPLGLLAQVEDKRQKFAEADAHWARAIELREKRGPSYELLRDLENQGYSLYNRKKPAEACALYERALPVAEKLYGPDDLEVAKICASLGHGYVGQGRLADAEARFRRAIQIREKKSGPEHASLVSVLKGLATALEKKSPDEAHQALARAKAIEARANAAAPAATPAPGASPAPGK